MKSTRPTRETIRLTGTAPRDCLGPGVFRTAAESATCAEETRRTNEAGKIDEERAAPNPSRIGMQVAGKIGSLPPRGQR